MTVLFKQFYNPSGGNAEGHAKGDNRAGRRACNEVKILSQRTIKSARHFLQI